MATQTDVQQLIQSLVPSGVNNGNPNTVYNVPPPTLNAQGQWTQGRLPQAASIGGLNLPAILAQLPQGNLGGGPTAGAPAGPLLPSFPPPGGTGGGGAGGGTGGGGGFVPPDMSTPTPPLPVTGGGGGGGDSFFEPYRNPQTGILQQGQTLPGSWTDPYTGGFGTVGPWAGGMTGSLGGSGGGGTGDWRVGVDNIANLLGIDPYMQGTQQWNFKGAISDILHQLAGVPQWLTQGASEVFGFGPGQNFFDQQLMRQFEDKKGQTMDQMFKKTMEGLQDDTLAKYGIDPTEGQSAGPKMTGGGRDSRSAAGAGSTTIAEGLAAQQMVEGWAQAQRDALMKALAEGAMNRQYNVQR